MAIRFQTANNYIVTVEDLGDNFLKVNLAYIECPDEYVAYLILEYTEDIITFSKTFILTEWQSFYKDDWPVQLAIRGFLRCGNYMSTFDRVKINRGIPCGFWEGLAFEPDDEDEGMLVYRGGKFFNGST